MTTTYCTLLRVELDFADEACRSDHDFYEAVADLMSHYRRIAWRIKDYAGPGGGWPVIEVTAQAVHLTGFLRDYAGDRQDAAYLLSTAKEL